MEFMGYLAPGTVETGWLKLYARAIASTFLFIAGISMALSSKPEIRWPSFWKRFAMIAGAALLISVVTRIAMPGEWIFFGILHCIAVLSLIGVIFVRLPLVVTSLVTLALIAAWLTDTFISPGALRSALFNQPLLLPPRTNDYVPLFPWAAAFMTGLTLALIALRTSLPQRLKVLGTGNSLLARTGRHSLAFYLIHQPVLISVAYGLTFVMPPAKPDPVETYLKQCNASCLQQADEALCRSFCQCTLEKLQTQNLFAEFQSGAIKPDDGRVVALADECSANAD
jgi:uncharacterized membrane protein